MTFSKQIKKLSLAVVVMLMTFTTEAQVVVVVSPQSPVDQLSQDQVTNIFLGKTTRMPDGELVVPVDQDEAAAIRNEFYIKLANKTPAQLKAYWSKLIFTGRGRPPKEMANSREVKHAIINRPETIGYIAAGEVDGTVKVIFTIP
jgi:ABC-type phosphate transport system substrate-binding protein